MTAATIRRSLAICAVAFGLVALPHLAYAQGAVKGKVVDAQGNPVEGAKVSIQSTDKGGKPLETKTNKKGEYMQVGLSPGDFKITASKGDLSDSHNAHVGLDMMSLDFKLAPAANAAMATKEKASAVNKAFGEGVDLVNANKFDEAVAKFQEVITTVPNCPQCYTNIGMTQARQSQTMQDATARQAKMDEAEAAFKKAIELKPDSPDPYTGLRDLYNAEKKFDQAADMGKKAMDLSAAPAAGTAGAPGAAGAAAPAGGNASGVYNQGIIFWNAGKYADAKTQFEEAIKLDPSLAEAHYWLGMAFVNLGGGTPDSLQQAKPHFETYLKLAPTGPYAETVKGILASIK
jgi:tetratricopeptide (TPR) repeat protein